MTGWQVPARAGEFAFGGAPLVYVIAGGERCDWLARVIRAPDGLVLLSDCELRADKRLNAPDNRQDRFLLDDPATGPKFGFLAAYKSEQVAVVDRCHLLRFVTESDQRHRKYPVDKFGQWIPRPASVRKRLRQP